MGVSASELPPCSRRQRIFGLAGAPRPRRRCSNRGTSLDQRLALAVPARRGGRVLNKDRENSRKACRVKKAAVKSARFTCRWSADICVKLKYRERTAGLAGHLALRRRRRQHAAPQLRQCSSEAVFAPGRCEASTSSAIYYLVQDDLINSHSYPARQERTSLESWKARPLDQARAKDRLGRKSSTSHQPSRHGAEHARPAQGGVFHTVSRRNAASATAKSSGPVMAADPHRIVERGQQQADHGGVDAGQCRLGERPAAQGLPERQHADHQQERRQEDRDEADRGAEPSRSAAAPSRRRDRRRR